MVQKRYGIFRNHILTAIDEFIINRTHYSSIMKDMGELEEELASKAEPILGFRPSSKIKRGPIGIIISIICIAIVFLELNRSGVI